MRNCPYCKVNIAGDLVKCPLCQSKLMGTPEAPCYPKFSQQKKRSMFYKVQLFIAWAVLIVGIGLDFTLNLKLPGFTDLHWSLLLAMWLVAIEFGIMRQFKPGTGSAGKVTNLVLITLALWCVTAYYFGFLKVTLELVIPIALTATTVACFILAMIDEHGNDMAYLLSGLVLTLVPGLILFFVQEKLPLAWSICLMISVVLFAGTVIFRGRAVLGELEKRFHV